MTGRAFRDASEPDEGSMTNPSEAEEFAEWLAEQAATPAAPVQDDDAITTCPHCHSGLTCAHCQPNNRLTPDRVTPLVEALRSAREAIASLPDDALGMVVVPPRGEQDFGHEYPVRDELLSVIDTALRDGGFDA